MRALRHLLLTCFLLALTFPAVRAATPQDDRLAIQQVMVDQQAAWNRSDVAGFMAGYKNAEDTTFVGSTVRHGYRQILKSYLKHYTSPAQMGQLTFSALDIRILPGAHEKAMYAVVTGRFHLDRAQRGEVSQDDGVFSLVWQNTSEGWRIILDHTS